MVRTRWLAVGLAVLALTTGRALASDASADRDAALRAMRAEVAAAGQESAQPKAAPLARGDVPAANCACGHDSARSVER
jgi:hypothetical protein